MKIETREKLARPKDTEAKTKNVKKTAEKDGTKGRSNADAQGKQVKK